MMVRFWDGEYLGSRLVRYIFMKKLYKFNFKFYSHLVSSLISYSCTLFVKFFRMFFLPILLVCLDIETKGKVFWK